MDVKGWLHGLGLGRYAQAFADNDVDAAVLRTLTSDDLAALGVASLGHRKRLIAAIAALGEPAQTAEPQPAPAPHAERRRLTVMFVDLVGSTALSAGLDPEDMRGVLHTYQNTVTGEIARVGGRVAKLMGDGVLAYFGWPQADEDDAERSVRAGLAVAQAVGRLLAPDGAPLAARVGIASGLVVVGDLVGEGAAREELVVGDTPNLAARLQQIAAPGAVVIADGTRRLLGGVFELRELPPSPLKGFAEPVGGFEVVGERPAGSRFEARRAGRLAPMVGRDQELALVRERWRQAAAGEGQAILLVGEAGIGKSRLVQAMLDEAVADEQTALRYQCSPHHTGTALWPVAQQILLAAEIAPGTPDALKLDKLAALLRQGVDDIGAAAPLIAALLGIDTGERYKLPELSPQQQRTRTLGALVEQMLGLARRHPVLLVLEDAHWIDPTTLELVGQALDRIAGARVLMLLTSRPDNQPLLGGHPHVTRLTLNRLGRGATDAIVAHLSGATSLPMQLLGEIAERTDGVPLFIEELTKAVLEAGAAGPGAVPASLHASLMARLDRVPGVKEVAQVAACIGRELSYKLLAAVAALPEPALLAALDRLVAAELVFPRGTPPEASYIFKHALVRDAAHESLLKVQRQQWHARIARALEVEFPETVDAEPELLAQHLAEAGLAEQAIDYWQRAGQQSLARSAMAEAVAQLGNGLQMLERLSPGPERRRRELALQLALGQAWIHAKGFASPETGRTYDRARELCSELGDVPELFPALYGQWVVSFQRGELTAAHERAWELLRTAQAKGDQAAQVTGHRVVAATLCQLGRLEESRRHGEAGLALYDPLRDRTSAYVYAIDSRVMCLSWLSHVLLLQGYPDQALTPSGTDPVEAARLVNPNSLAIALCWSCLLLQLRRDHEEAGERADAVIALAEEQGFPLYRAAGTVVRGWAWAAAGRLDEGVVEIRRGLADYAATRAEMWSPYFLSVLAQVEGSAGRAAIGLDLLADGIERSERTGVRWIEAELHRLRGELLLTLPAPDRPEAEACFRRALAVAGEQGAKLWELRAATSFARALCDQGKQAEARNVLQPAYGWFTDGFAIPDLVEAKTLLDGVR